MNKKLIVYFSASGVTKRIAESLAKAVEGELFEIIPEVKYTEADLDWTNKQSRSSVEMSNRDFRPKIREKVKDIELYDTVFIGFPVWWYVAPTIINTFIEENSLKDKKVFVFCTSGSSGVEECVKDLKDKYPNINWKSGKRFTGKETNEEIVKWINE